MPYMWNGSGAPPATNNADESDERTRLAASALAAYRNTTAAAAAVPPTRTSPDLAESVAYAATLGNAATLGSAAARLGSAAMNPFVAAATYAAAASNPAVLAATIENQAREVLLRQEYLRRLSQQGIEEASGGVLPAAGNEAGGAPESVLVQSSVTDDMDVEDTVAAVPLRNDGDSSADIEATPLAPPPSKKKTTPRKRAPSKSSRKKGSVHPTPTWDDPVPDMTEVDYVNLEALMVQFCKVPLLAEFSRPVSLLHPELLAGYTKIVKHPIDLGKVCRAIRRREYKNTRAVQLDMWRIFTNCIKYHSHPSNRDNAVPAFISIALHLREYFNALWGEFMLPSDPPPPGSKQHRWVTLLREAFDRRDVHRTKRLKAIGMTLLSGGFLKKVVAAVRLFVEKDGKVDDMDKDTILDQPNETNDMETVKANLRQLCQQLTLYAGTEKEYVVDDFVADVKKSFNDPSMFEDATFLRVQLSNRVTHMLERLLVPIYEANCRGVNQSSIWGCMAAAIWARESSKKPFWPALVLGIIAPEDQKEDWHSELTERNEARLPDKLRTELAAGKKRAEQALKRQKNAGAEQSSYFLVEFMGTHEFIWVKEADIIENFDPTMDPNQTAVGGNVTKKKRSRVADSKVFNTGLEEGKWAMEEFEMQLSDTCGDLADVEDNNEDGDMNYSYAFLGQSDDEAEEENDDFDEFDMSPEDLEEINEMLATEGLFDFSPEALKNAKKRAAMRKKKLAEEAKKERMDKRSKDARNRKKKRGSESKRGGDSRRKHDTASEQQRFKKPRYSDSESALQSLVPSHEKRKRALAIVKGYVTRIADKEEMKTLGLGGVLNMPASIVDSSGLLGMALAFRAAAGEIPMPENGDEDTTTRAWETVDIDTLKTSEERTRKLQEQLVRLEKKLEEVRAATKRRKELTQEALQKKENVTQKVLDEEADAKRIIMKNTKKKSPAKPEPKIDEIKEVFADTSDAIRPVEEVVTVQEADESVPMEVDEEAVVAVAEVEPYVTEGKPEME